jgi:radical SAM protein with 4Fe4S-binding SPASM domain
VDFCNEAKVKYIFFTGGEPLLYPYLNEVLKYIKAQEHQITTAVATNGILLDNLVFCRNLISSGLDYIDISMKGKSASEWINTTGVDGYQRQQKAVHNLRDLNVDFTCSMVITRENVFSLCDSVQTAIEQGAKQFSFTFVIDNGTAIKNKGIYLMNNNPFELIEAFLSQRDQLDAITEDWWIEYSFPLCVYTEDQMKVLEGKFATPCQLHKQNAVTFDTQLNLLPCDMYFNDKLGRLGEDFNGIKEFLELRKNNPYKHTIEKITSLPSDRCVNCQYLEKCLGGCPVLWKNYSFEKLQKLKRGNK